MGCGLATHGPEHHSPPALGTLSDRNVIAQVSWEDATSCTRINGCFNLLEALNRSQVSMLMFCTHPFLNLGQPVRMLEFCQPFTMFCSLLFLTVPSFIRPVTIFFSNVSNRSNVHSTRHGAHPEFLDFSNCSNFYPTFHDLDQENHNCQASRSLPCSAPPPPGPLQSLIQWPFLPEFLHTSVPSEPDPLLRLPFTKASTSFPTDKSLFCKSTKRNARGTTSNSCC